MDSKCQLIKSLAGMDLSWLDHILYQVMKFDCNKSSPTWALTQSRLKVFTHYTTAAWSLFFAFLIKLSNYDLKRQDRWIVLMIWMESIYIICLQNGSNLNPHLIQPGLGSQTLFKPKLVRSFDSQDLDNVNNYLIRLRK